MANLRGIFLNDEAPCLTGWVKKHYGTGYGDHRFYADVFELILRLKGNFFWPAMWSWAFYADDPLNSKTADEMGVIISTSHHEPMARNHQEWSRKRKEYGAWNYVTNKKVLDYPTVARRVIEKEVTLKLPASEDGTYILDFKPLHPAVVLEKIVIDCGGYEKSYLYMNESECKRN